jgi:hypothetical protein
VLVEVTACGMGLLGRMATAGGVELLPADKCCKLTRELYTARSQTECAPRSTGYRLTSGAM